MRAHRDGAALGNAVAAEPVGSEISVADVYYDFDPVGLKPTTYCATAVNVPKLHDKGHIAIKAEVREDDAVELLEKLKVFLRLLPDAFEPAIVFVEVDPPVEVIRMKRLGERNEFVGNPIGRFYDGEFEDSGIVRKGNEKRFEYVFAAPPETVVLAHYAASLSYVDADTQMVIERGNAKKCELEQPELTGKVFWLSRGVNHAFE